MVSISGIKRGNQKWKLSTSADDPITRAAARALWRINEDEWRRRQRRRRVAPFPRKKRKNSIIKKKGEGNEIKIYSFTGLQVNTRIEWKFQRIFFLKIIRKINEKSRKVSGQNDIESVCVCVCVESKKTDALPWQRSRTLPTPGPTRKTFSKRHAIPKQFPLEMNSFGRTDLVWGPTLPFRVAAETIHVSGSIDWLAAKVNLPIFLENVRLLFAARRLQQRE